MKSRIQYNNPKKIEALGLPYHYEMVSDQKRVAPFKQAIEKTCKNKTVLESGTGSAIFSILAAKAGAKKVYAVEMDSEIVEFAKGNILRNGLKKRIKLIQKDINEVTLGDLDDQKVDVVIAENLSTWQITEPQIPIMNHINKHLIKRSGVVIPTLIFNYFELAQTCYNFENIVDLKTHYFEFTGIRKPAILSKKTLFNKIDLNKTHSLNIDKTIKAKVTHDGTLNSLRLTSPLQVFSEITFDSSDSLMPPVIIPLKKDISVSNGDIVGVHIKYKNNTNWNEVTVEVK
ncbi:MAG: 50S ribosomal protein L11 methyltransferase [bacterium]